MINFKNPSKDITGVNELCIYSCLLLFCLFLFSLLKAIIELKFVEINKTISSSLINSAIVKGFGFSILLFSLIVFY